MWGYIEGTWCCGSAGASLGGAVADVLAPLRDCLKRAKTEGGASVAGGADGFGATDAATVASGGLLPAMTGDALFLSFCALLLLLRMIKTTNTIMTISSITLQAMMVIYHKLVLFVKVTLSGKS